MKRHGKKQKPDGLRKLKAAVSLVVMGALALERIQIRKGNSGSGTGR